MQGMASRYVSVSRGGRNEEMGHLLTVQYQVLINRIFKASQLEVRHPPKTGTYMYREIPSATEGYSLGARRL
jgi:hypothetical protein